MSLLVAWMSALIRRRSSPKSVSSLSAAVGVHVAGKGVNGKDDEIDKGVAVDDVEASLEKAFGQRAFHVDETDEALVCPAVEKLTTAMADDSALLGDKVVDECDDDDDDDQLVADSPSLSTGNDFDRMATHIIKPKQTQLHVLCHKMWYSRAKG
jgi:hypothetical protein